MITDSQKELKIKLIPKQTLNRRLNLPKEINSCAIEILATEKDRDEIESFLPSICKDTDYYGKFLSYGNPYRNICDAVQDHNHYLKNHRYVALRAKREVLLRETGEEGSRMEQEILQVKNAKGFPLFHRVDYNRKQDVIRLHFVSENEQEAFKYEDTTFKTLYAETARTNHMDYEPVQNVYPRFLHYEYAVDVNFRRAPANLLPRRNARQPRTPAKATPNGPGYGNNRQAPQTPTAPGYGTPNGQPNAWNQPKKPWNDDASVGTSAPMAIDTDEIKRLIEETIQERLEKRDKELEETRIELSKAKEET